MARKLLAPQSTEESPMMNKAGTREGTEFSSDGNNDEDDDEEEEE